MERNQRRFTLGDTMILVAATAAALALMELPLQPDDTAFEILHRFFERPRGGWSFGAVVALIIGFTFWAIIPFVATWTVAAFTFQLRRPRPPRGRVGRQPGAMAALLGTIAVSFSTAWGVVMELAFSSFIREFLFIAGFASILAAAMIAGGWIAMAVGGRWRPEPTWLDRLGRLLGVSWIVAGLAVILSLGFLE
jgi:hypothetical protein